jgi:Tol biopolymer transport system component
MVIVVAAGGAYAWQAGRGNYDPVDTPLAWTAAGGLVSARLEQYSSADVYTSTCRGSGLFAVADGESPGRPLAVGAPVCQALRRDEGVAIAPDGTWAVFSEWVEPNTSRLARLHLATDRVDALDTGCAVYLQNPAISPDGARIAAVGLCRDREQPDWSLYVMNSEGSGLRPLADGVAEQAPSWAPDGQRLTASGNGQVLVLDAAGGERRAVTRGAAPAWSPDGAWIAFLDSVPGGARGARGIFVVRVDGSGRGEISRNREHGSYERVWGPRPEGEPVSGLVWSPDSRWIAFSRRFDAGTFVWRVEVATGRTEPVTRASR